MGEVGTASWPSPKKSSAQQGTESSRMGGSRGETSIAIAPCSPIYGEGHCSGINIEMNQRDGSLDPFFVLLFAILLLKSYFCMLPVYTQPCQGKTEKKAPQEYTMSCCGASTGKTSLKTPKTTSSSSKCFDCSSTGKTTTIFPCLHSVRYTPIA